MSLTTKSARGSARIALLGIALAALASVPARAANHKAPYDVGKTSSPRIFAPAIVSTEDDEVAGAFSPDGREFYFSKVIQYTTFPRLAILCVSKFANGKWTQPEVLPFSGQYLDFIPRMSPDGKTLFFSSSRPAPGKTTRVLRIWSVERTTTGWGEPAPLPAPVNLDDHWDWGASVSRNGTVYFASDRGSDNGHIHIFRSRFSGGTYSEPEKLGPEVNSDFSESDPYVCPDESFLIFASSGDGVYSQKDRPETIKGGGAQYGRGDLYISVQQNGHWTPARHLGNGINTFAEEGSPFITPDGKYLFFTSERSPFIVPTAHRFDYADLNRTLHSTLNGHGNIFYITVDALGLPKTKEDKR